MICQLQGTVYRPRNKKVFYYESESGAEFDKDAQLIGLEKEDVSEKLGDQIVRLSPYLQEVQKSIRDNIFYQKNAKIDAKIERDAFLNKGYKEVRPGIWEKNGYQVKEVLSDYPVNLEEKEEEKVGEVRRDEKN